MYPSIDSLWITAVFTILYQLSYFFIAYVNKFDKVTDFAGGSNFAINALISLLYGLRYAPVGSKKIVATCCVLVWALRLAVFLLLRVLKAGEDKRFDEMRDKFFNFLAFWVFQMFWVWTVGLSLNLLNASDDNSSFGSATDIAGLVMFIVGFLIEAVSDQQKFSHRFKVVPQFRENNPGKTAPIIKAGLWHYSRQPNYFGEILLWWGMFVMCLHGDSFTGVISTAYVTLLSPIFITLLLLFLSGIPLAEIGAQKKYLSPDNKDPESRRDYLEYRTSTSVLIPLPNFVYRSIPLLVKRVFLFEFSLYESKFLKDALNDNSSD